MTQPTMPGIEIAPVPQVEIGTIDDAVRARQAQLAGQAQAQAVAAQPSIARQRATALDAQREALEAKHGSFGTVAGGLTRGALDALLAPGALAGAGIESTGAAFGWPGWEEFGRGLGQASQGSELLGVITAAPELIQGEGAEAFDQYRRSASQMKETEQAWPMLSALSRLSGTVAFGVGTGALASSPGLAASAGVAAVEGGGFGAQTAYEKNAPLRDVVASTLIGTALGGGLTVGIGKGVPLARQAAAGGLRDFAEKRAVKSAVGNYKAAYNQITRHGKEPERINRLGRKLLDRGVDLDDLDDTIRGIGGEVDDAATRLETVATTLDEAGVTVSKREALGQADALIQKYRSEPFGSYRAIADRLEREVAPLREGADLMKFSDYWRMRRAFDDLLYDETGKPLGGAVGKAMEGLRGRLDEQLTKAVSGADEGVGKLWKAAKEDYGDFATLKRASDELALNREKNRWVSPSDQGLGAAGAVLAAASGDVSGIGAALIGAGVAGANKLAREKLPGRLARWADALAGHADDAGHTVSVAAAGGKEAQEAITKIERARIAIREAGERAGPNPTVQQTARNAATQEVGERLAKEAGEFDANWIKKPPTTLQKVFHRSQILDQVAQDTSAAVQKVAAVRPTLATPLAQRRIAKLLKDADGPAAIGGVQMRLGKLMEQLPRSAEGETLRGALKAYSQQLQTAGTAETMRTAHDLVLRFSQAAKVAADPSVKAFSARAAADIAQDLSGAAWGIAGQHYAKLSKAPQDALAALSDPAALRDALRTVELRGKLVGAVRDGAEQLRQAQLAASELTGAKATINEAQLKSLERLFEQAEEAVTLDGGPVGRVLEYFAQKQDERVAGSLGAHVARGLGDQPGSAVENAVAHAVKSRLAKVAKVLHTAGHTAKHAGIHTAQAGAIGAATGAEGQAVKAARPVRAAAFGAAGAALGARTLLTPQERQQQFKMRSELLASVVSDPETDIADGLAAIHQIAPGLDSLAALDLREKLENLDREAPKMKLGFRGPEMPSRQDIETFHALFEATTDPLSVFDDFASGNVNYTKVEYAWRQYPGLKLAAQMGLQDVLYTQLEQEQRAVMPENILTQLDNLFGLDGSLQPTRSADFVRTVDAVAAQAASKQKPNAKKPLELPAQEPSFTQRISGAGR